MAAVYHGIVPAIAEGDLGSLRAAMREIHQTGFKRREVDGQSHVVCGLLDQLHTDLKLAAGMSSLGPLVYAITSSKPNTLSTTTILETLASEIDYLGCVSCRNMGYEMVGD